MWTPETRAEHDRDDLRYPSDLTDAEWQILAPLLPPPAETGRHRCWPMRVSAPDENSPKVPTENSPGGLT